MSTFAIRLKEAMTDAKMGQSELARRASTEKVPVKQQNIQNILSGRDKKSKHTAAIAGVLNVNFEWLAEGSGPKRTGSTAAVDASAGRTKMAAGTQAHQITVPIDLPSGAQLTTMFASMLEMADQPDPKGELAEKLAQSFPGVLKQTLTAFARNRLTATNAPDAAVPPRAKRPAERQRRART